MLTKNAAHLRVCCIFYPFITLCKLNCYVALHKNQKERYFIMGNKRKRNISKNVPNGTILHTRDEFLKDSGSYRKPGYKNKGNYRKVVVIDSNRNDDLAVVKLYSKSGKGLKGTNSRYKPFVETLDDENKRIKVGRKFIRGKQKLSKENVYTIKKDCFTNPTYRYKNKKKVRRIKGRK